MSPTRKRPRRAFVVTLAALGTSACNKAPDPNTASTGSYTDGTSASATASASANSVPSVDPWGRRSGEDKEARKRAVRSPVPKAWGESYGKPIDWKDAKGLNPRNADGRTIYARADGHCVVRLPPPPGTAIGPPGSFQGSIAVTDCPDLMQDRAWDTCLGDTLTQLNNGDCICPRSGNPPPPPMKAECPKKSE